MFDWEILLGWDYSPAQALWLDSGFAPAGPDNWFTALRPSVVFTFSWGHK